MRKINILYWTAVILCISCTRSSDITVLSNYEEALLQATSNNKDILMVFDFLGNPTGKIQRMIHDKDYKSALSKYVVVVLNVDIPSKEGVFNRELQNKKFATRTQPQCYIINKSGQIIKGPLGYCSKLEFISFIR